MDPQIEFCYNISEIGNNRAEDQNMVCSTFQVQIW